MKNFFVGLLILDSLSVIAQDDHYNIVSYKYVVVFLTWGTLILELVLAAFVLVKSNKWNWKILLFFAVIFHLSIIFLHGLTSFFISMMGAIILYLVPKDFILKSF